VAEAINMTAENLDVRLLSFRSRRDESPQVLATALLEAGRLPEALEVVQSGLVDAEDDCSLLVLEGRAWFEQGDLPQAQAALLRAAKTHPREKDPYRWLAQVLMKRGEPTRAVQVLDRALSLDPNDRSLQQARARAERLARIASEADAPAPVADPVPAPAVVSAPAKPAVVEPKPKAAASAPAKPAAVEPKAKAAASAPAPAKPVAVEPKPNAVEPPAGPKLSVPSFKPLAAPPVAEPPAPRPKVVVAPPIALLKEEREREQQRAREREQERARERERELERERERQSEVQKAITRERLTPVVPPRLDDDEDDEEEHTRAYDVPLALTEAERSAAGRGASHVPLGPQPTGGDEAITIPPPPMVEPKRASLEVLPDPTGPFALESEELDQDDAYDRRTGDSSSGYVPDSIEVDPDIGRTEASRASAEPTDRYDAVENTATDQPEAPEEVLTVLRDQGIFEPAGVPSAEPWATKHEAPRAGNRLGKSLAVGWTVALMAAGGGYYGWTRFLETRRADARALIAQAVADAHDGDHERLVAAERRLVQARELDPKSDLAIESLLFVHAARALEDAAGDIGYLRATIARAERAAAPKGLVLSAKALLYTYDRNPDSARRDAEAALKAGANDARVLYLVGRLHQRMGLPDAEALLSQAAQKAPELSLAWLGQAEIARQTSRPDEAAQLFTQALGKDGRQLRAELWSVVLSSGPGQGPELLKKLDALKARVDHGSPADKLLAGLARAGVLLDNGDLDAARIAVKEASQISVLDPELLSLLGDRAASAGEHDLAYRAANAAMLAAPGNRRYRDALANVLLKRGDGRAVLAALEGLEDKGPWMLAMRARAALLSGSREAAEEAKRALSAHRQTEEGKADLDAASLLVRLDLRLGANAESLMAAARTLAQKAKDSPLAQSALGETLVLAAQGEAAVKVLDQARQLGADDADVYYLLGRAYRLVGDAAKSKQSLERSLLLSPSHVQAREVLGGLLLDSGDFASAEALFAKLEKDRVGTAATLGVVEALLGRGEVEAAKERLAALSEEKQALPSVQALIARVAIADHRAGEAVKLIEPLVAEDSELRTADMLVLYGDALYAANSVDTAAGAYDAALELDDTNPDALIGRAMAALRAEKLSQVDELLSAAETALTKRVRPQLVRANLLLTRAKGNMLRQKFELAMADLTKVIEVPNVPAEAFFWYAEVLAKTKSPGASENYTKYLEREPEGEYAGRSKKALAPR